MRISRISLRRVTGVEIWGRRLGDQMIGVIFALANLLI
jgi:hypothetical protein